MDIIETTTQKDFYGNNITRKKIKDGFFKDSNVISESQSKLAQSENNDCVVRAFMMALDLPYEKAHPVGRYFMIVRGHALALVDGILYGNSCEQYDGFRRPIRFVIECK